MSVSLHLPDPCWLRRCLGQNRTWSLTLLRPWRLLLLCVRILSSFPLVREPHLPSLFQYFWKLYPFEISTIRIFTRRDHLPLNPKLEEKIRRSNIRMTCFVKYNLSFAMFLRLISKINKFEKVNIVNSLKDFLCVINIYDVFKI